MNRIYLLLSLVVLAISAKSQPVDSLWIRPFHYQNNIYYEQGNNTVQLNFLTKAKDSTYRYYPANFDISASQTKGLGLNYKFFSVSFVYNTLLDVRAAHHLRDLSFNFSLVKRKWGVESFFGHYNGVVSVLDSGKFVANPNIRFDRVGARFHYIRKYARYSWRAPRDQSERQRKSSASLICLIVPSWNRVQSKNNLLPNDTLSYKYYQNQWGLRNVNTYKLEVMPGYAFTISLFRGRFFISPMWALGTGIAYNNYETTVFRTHNLKYTFCAYSEFNFGFNGARFYCCFNTFTQSYNSLLDPVYFQYKTTGGKITLGFRFGTLEKVIPEDIGVLLDRVRKRQQT